tara:strand:+ start:41 stop:1015 length:975 start_codon:yes stop_codon:yes gene_type:complete
MTAEREQTYTYTLPEGFKIAFGVSMGSSTVQGWYMTAVGDIFPLFTDVDPSRFSIKELKKSNQRILEFFNYLYSHTYDDRIGIFFNSFGYAIDGGKKKGEEIGIPYAWVEDTEQYTDTSLVSAMAVVISENPKFQNMFLGINRNWKTDHGQELGGQWAKQIQSYLDDKDFTECEWVVDLGGKSGTLYHRQGDIYVKRETIFADTTPNSLVDTPSEFVDYTNMEMAKLQQAGIDVSKLAILQTGEMREKNIEGVFSTAIGLHEYLPQEIESTYEAYDFMRTVLQTEEVSSFNLTPVDGHKFHVTVEPGMGIFQRVWSSIMCTFFG